MIDIVGFLDTFNSMVVATLRGDAPWWVYFIIIFIPVCIIFTIREFFCWFSKANKISSRLEKLDKRLFVLHGSVEEITRVIKQEIQRSKIHASSNVSKPVTGGNSEKSEHERNSEFKEALVKDDK